MARNDFPTPVVQDCTPNTLMNIYPCMECLTEKELLAVIVYILTVKGNYDLSEDLDQLMIDSACQACLTDKQMLQVITAMLAYWAGLQNSSMSDIRADVKCLLCAEPRKVKGLLVYLICQLFPAAAL